MVALRAFLHRLKERRNDENGIRRFFHQRLDVLTRQVLEKETSLSKDNIDELERLSSLVAIHETTRSRTILRAAAALLALLVFGVGLALMIRPVSDTNVILTVAASELGFRLRSPASLTRDLNVSSLELTGIGGVRLSDYKGRPEFLLATDQIEISPTRSSTVGLASMRADSAAKVTIAYLAPRPLRFNIQVDDSSSAPTASPTGSFVLVTPRDSVRDSLRLAYAKTKAIPVVRADRLLDLTVVLSDTANGLFSSPLRISELEPFRIEDVGDAIPDSISTLRSARLTFPDLNGVSREIHPSEVVRLAILRDGKLRELSLRSDRIVADFTGRVRDVTIGDKSVMPSRFEWMTAQNAAAVLWSTATSVLLTFFAIWRWWRRPT